MIGGLCVRNCDFVRKCDFLCFLTAFEVFAVCCPESDCDFLFFNLLNRLSLFLL